MALREVTREETSTWHQIGLTLRGEDREFKGGAGLDKEDEEEEEEEGEGDEGAEGAEGAEGRDEGAEVGADAEE